MGSDYTLVDALKAYRASLQKFDYFILGVILAILALSIQTFNPKSESFVFLIYVFWVLLLISLLAGFYRQERSNMFLAYDTDRLEAIYFNNIAKKEALEKAITKENRKLIQAYKIEKWTFTIALIVYAAFKIINTEIARQAALK